MNKTSVTLQQRVKGGGVGVTKQLDEQHQCNFAAKIEGGGLVLEDVVTIAFDSRVGADGRLHNAKRVALCCI